MLASVLLLPVVAILPFSEADWISRGVGVELDSFKVTLEEEGLLVFEILKNEVDQSKME